MRFTVVKLFPGSQSETKITRANIQTSPPPSRHYIHSSEDFRAYRMEGAIKYLATFIRRHQADINAGRLAELTETLRLMREDEAALSRRRREALGS